MMLNRFSFVLRELHFVPISVTSLDQLLNGGVKWMLRLNKKRHRIIIVRKVNEIKLSDVTDES